MSDAGKKLRPYYIAGKFVRLLTYVGVAVIAFALGRVFDSIDLDWRGKPAVAVQPDIIVGDDSKSSKTQKDVVDRIVGDQEVTGESRAVSDGPLVAPNKVDAQKHENLLEKLANEKQSVGGEN
jgi:hypothetical protein